MKNNPSFSKQFGNWTFIFYPKAWTIPNMAIRHVHNGFRRKSYALGERRNCLGLRSDRTCNEVCPEELVGEAVKDMLPRDHAMLHETVTFKSKELLRLAPEWYVRRYNNLYTLHQLRFIFYHDCLHKANLNTFYKGTYDHLLPYLEVPNACQVCGTAIPKGVLMATRLQKANIHV